MVRWSVGAARLGFLDPVRPFLRDLPHGPVPRELHLPAPSRRLISARLTGFYGDRLRIHGTGPQVGEHLRDLELLPDGFHRRLAEYFAGRPEGGIDIVDGSATEILPRLKGVRPAGYSEGTTWDDVRGAHDPPTRRMVLGVGPDHGGPPLALHEAGHALDHALRNASQSAEFRRLYGRLGPLDPFHSQAEGVGLREPDQ
jgi:hypothetical protein